jgi:lipopolysaccharide transport protein LptA
VKTAFLFVLMFTSSLWADTPNPISVKAQAFQVDQKKKVLVATGSVTIQQADIILKGKKAHYSSDKSEVTVEGDVSLRQKKLFLTCEHLTHHIDEGKIVVNEAVKFQSDSIKAEAGQAEYFINSKQMILSKNPKAWQNQDEVAGTTLTLDLINNRFTSTGRSKLRLSAETLEKSP